MSGGIPGIQFVEISFKLMNFANSICRNKFLSFLILHIHVPVLLILKQMTIVKLQEMNNHEEITTDVDKSIIIAVSLIICKSVNNGWFPVKYQYRNLYSIQSVPITTNPKPQSSQN